MLGKLDIRDRPTILLAGGIALAGLCALLAFAAGSGDARLLLVLVGIVTAPLLAVAALRVPYVFPYGLYVVLVPFDNLLKIGGSGTLTKLLGIAATGAIALLIVRNKRIERPPLAMYLWLAYLAWSLLSMLWTADLENALPNVSADVSLILMYAVLALAPIDERNVRAICACIVLGGVLSSLYGMYLLHQSPGVLSDDGRLMINVDMRAIDANHYANALLAPIALSLMTLLNARRPAKLLWAVAALTILISGLVLSLSREALMGALLIVVVTIAFSKRRLLGAAIGIPLLVAVPLLVPSIGARMASGLSTGGAGRTSIWHVGWVAFQQHPLFGWGVGAFSEAYNRDYLSVYQAVVAGWTRASHNSLLHAGVELGVVGVVLLVTAFGASFRQFRGITRASSLYDLRTALTASLLALALVSNFIDLTDYKYLWIVLTVVAQMRTAARTADSLEDAPRSYVPPPPRPPSAVRQRAASPAL